MKKTPKKSPAVKPLLRGHFHEWACYASILACAFLLTKSGDAFISVLVYSISLCGLFAISALYHRIQWDQKKRKWMRRADHAAIFLLIAGTATPICTLALDSQSSPKALALFWAVGIAGVLQSLFWGNAPKWFAAILYVGMGWLAFPYMQEFKVFLGSTHLFYLLLGGIFYTVGAVIYAFKFPNPWPKHFGYHEIFHIFVIVGAAFHYLVVWELLAHS